METTRTTRALITGASSGIGAALARRMAARGVEVWLAARRRELLDEGVAAITAAGGKAHALILDVARADETYATLGQLDDEIGGFDVVVANAGLAGDRTDQALHECSWEDIRDVLHTNVIGAVATLAPFIPRMVKRGAGQLVGVSS